MITQDASSLSDFKLNTDEIIEQMKKSGQPMVLTVGGRPELVVQDAEAYQKLLEAVDQAETIEGIREALDHVEHGRTRPFQEVFDEIRHKHGIQRRID